MRLITSTLTLAATVVGMGTPAKAILGVGDKAPPLHIAEWVQGAPVDLKKESSKRIHMVEFWAVWCPPCTQSVPLLTKIQDKYKDKLAIIGVTAPDMRGNSPSAIRKFVKRQGRSMSYHVAIDDRERTTNAYLVAAQAMGIPHAFLVDKEGRIAWQGSPLDPMIEDVIDRLVKGTYDAKLEAELNKRFQALDWPLATGQWEAVTRGLADILKLDPANEVALRALRRVYVEEMGDASAFRQWVQSHTATHRSDGQVMSLLATLLFESDTAFQLAPELALTAAKAAYEADQRTDSSVLALYALAHYRVGALDRAIALQKQALDASEAEFREEVQARYEFYTTCKKLQSSLQ